MKELAEAQLEIDETAVPWGGVVTGALILRGLRRVHRITHSVVATLSQSSDDTHSVLGSCVVLSDGLSIAAGESFRFPFQIEMPWGVRFRDRCELSVSVRSGIWHQGPRVFVWAVPPAECVKAVQAFAQVARMWITGWDLTIQGGVRVDLKPEAEPHLLRHARLSLQHVAEDWYGELALSVRSRWRPVTVGVPFLAREAEEAQAQFRKILREAGLQEGMEWSLPVPAEAPQLADDGLPRPSEAPQPVAHDLPAPSGPCEASRDVV